MSIKNVLKPIAAQAVNSAGLSGVGMYDPLSAATGLEVSCVILRIINASNTIVTISFDGAVLHDVVPAGGVLQLEAQPNGQPQGYSCLFSRGQRIYVAGAAGVGTIYLTGYFQPNI